MHRLNVSWYVIKTIITECATLNAPQLRVLYSFIADQVAYSQSCTFTQPVANPVDPGLDWNLVVEGSVFGKVASHGVSLSLACQWHGKASKHSTQAATGPKLCYNINLRQRNLLKYWKFCSLNTNWIFWEVGAFSKKFLTNWTKILKNKWCTSNEFPEQL